MAKKEWLKAGVDGLQFGERLEDLIKIQNTTATAVAKETGVAQSALSGYINNGRAPDCAAIIALANHFSVSTDYLLGLSNVKTPSTNIQAVISYTGLSEDNVATLNTHKVTSEFDPPLIYNEERDIKGDELFLDCANDLLDAIYENRNSLLGIYYLIRSLGGSIAQYDPTYYDETRERDLLAHGHTTMPAASAARLSCIRFGNAIENFLAQKYINTAVEESSDTV